MGRGNNLPTINRFLSGIASRQGFLGYSLPSVITQAHQLAFSSIAFIMMMMMMSIAFIIIIIIINVNSLHC